MESILGCVPMGCDFHGIRPVNKAMINDTITIYKNYKK